MRNPSVWIRGIAATGALIALVATGGAVSATPPFDAICVMDADSYCTIYEGHTFNTPAYHECRQRHRAAHMPGGMCAEG